MEGSGSQGSTPTEEEIGTPSADAPDTKRLVFSKPDPSIIHFSKDRIPVWKKLCYAVGAMPYAMCNTVVGFYFSIFLLEVAILDPVYVLLIVFTGRVWDAISDPTVGYFCNRTRTPLGRLRPWMLGAMVPVAIVYSFMWFVPPTFEDTPSYWKFLYYLVFYFSFQSLLTCIHVPYTSLTMHLSHSNKERDSATLYRMVFEVIGTLLGVVVFTIYFTGFVVLNGGKEEDCSGGVRETDVRTQRAYRYHAITLGVLTVFFVLVTFLTVREQKDIKTEKISFFAAIKTTLSFKPYLTLFLIELFSWLAVNFIQGNFALYIKYSLQLEKQYPYVIAVLLVVTILWMPLWQTVLKKIGKKMTFFIGMWCLTVTLLSLLFIDFAGDNAQYIVYPIAMLGGAGIAVGYLLPWSMLPDVVDEAFLASGVRREEFFYAFFVFGTKFSSGVTLGISTGILKLAEYNEERCDQPWSVPLTLKLLVTVPPVIFIQISLLFLLCYPINEKRREETRQQLQERRISSTSPTNIAENTSSGNTSHMYVRKGNTFQSPTHSRTNYSTWHSRRTPDYSTTMQSSVEVCDDKTPRMSSAQSDF